MFLAGASGVIGYPLAKMLAAAGYTEHSLEQQTLNGKFATAIVLRNGWFFGADSGSDTPVDFAPPVHVDAAVKAAFLAVDGGENVESGIYNVADNDPRVDTSKFRRAFPEWSAAFRFK